nr:hypothetical protein 8 [Gammaproteobacteria bacterium]
MGKLLKKAREQFPADQEFGKWRKEELPWISERTAHEHMQVADKFGSRMSAVQHLGHSVLVQLTKSTTPPEAVEEVLEHDEITVREAKEIIMSKENVKRETQHDYRGHYSDVGIRNLDYLSTFVTANQL